MGGFVRNARVKFNDVELCYHLYDKGYVNVVRNDVAPIITNLKCGMDDSVKSLKSASS